MTDSLFPQQHWGNGRVYQSFEDVRTEDHGETVVLQIRDSEGYRCGTAKMTRAAALDLIEYLTEAVAVRDRERTAIRRRGRTPFIDNGPAAEARAMGTEMFMMAVPHDISGYASNQAYWDDIRLRAQARTVIQRMTRVYMAEPERGYWADEEIKDLLASLPANTVDVFTALPSEDIEQFFRSCVDELRNVQRQIDGIGMKEAA